MVGIGVVERGRRRGMLPHGRYGFSPRRSPPPARWHTALSERVTETVETGGACNFVLSPHPRQQPPTHVLGILAVTRELGLQKTILQRRA